MRSVLLENPYALIPILFVCQLVLVTIWSRRRTRAAGRDAVAGLVVGALLIVVQAVVETDVERIESVCQAMALAVEEGVLDTLARHVSSDVAIEANGRVWDKAELLEQIGRGLDRWGVEELRLSQFEIEVDGDGAHASFQVRCRLIAPEMIVPNHVSRWRLQFAREDESWKVRDIQLARTRWMPFDSLGDLLR